MRVDAPELDDVLAVLRSYRAAARERGLEIVGVVGSVARGEARPDSDVDVVYEIIGRPSLFDLGALLGELSKRLGRDVDLVNLSTVRPRTLRAMQRDLVRA